MHAVAALKIDSGSSGRTSSSFVPVAPRSLAPSYKTRGSAGRPSSLPFLSSPHRPTIQITTPRDDRSPSFELAISSSTHTHTHTLAMAGSGSGSPPCASCKLLRRRCTQECVFAPYFPPEDPHKFAIVHKVFGASNVSKMLQELPAQQRADAVSSLVYEANARVRDPVYGCVGAISYLQQQVSHLQVQLALAKAEVLCGHRRPTSSAKHQQLQQHQQMEQMDGEAYYYHSHITQQQQQQNGLLMNTLNSSTAAHHQQQQLLSSFGSAAGGSTAMMLHEACGLKKEFLWA